MRTALVTGGAKRIGRALVERLARERLAVAIHCNASRADADELAAAIEREGGRACVVVGDLAEAGAVAGLVAAASEGLGRPIDLLVNNASVFEPDGIADLDRAAFERTLAINLTAPLVLARDLAAGLPEGAEGLVVNLLDQRVWKETPAFFSYQISKSALWTATRTMAQALAPRVRVCAIGPGPTLVGPRQHPADFARQSASVPLRHGGGPDEIADALVYLLRARSVTGQMIAVDGGQHLAWETPDVTQSGE